MFLDNYTRSALEDAKQNNLINVNNLKNELNAKVWI